MYIYVYTYVYIAYSRAPPAARKHGSLTPARSTNTSSPIPVILVI